MRTCCPTSSVARPGRTARILGAAALGRSAPSSPRRAIRSTTPGSKPPRRRASRTRAITTVSMIRAYCYGTGPGTVVPGGLHAFVKTRPELAVPDIEFMFRGAPAQAYLWFPLIRPAYVDGYGIRPTLLHPDSRGEILLRSADARDPPRIIYNFFSAPNDLPRLREGVKRARDVAYQKPMAPYRGPETSPGEGVKTDAE